MPFSDPLTPEPKSPEQERPVWPVFAVFGVLWLGVCALALALMMGWLSS